MLQVFLLCLKKTSHKPLKIAGAKKSFSNVYIIDTTCFDECFRCDNWKTLFLQKFIVTRRSGATTMSLRSLKQMF